MCKWYKSIMRFYSDVSILPTALCFFLFFFHSFAYVFVCLFLICFLIQSNVTRYFVYWFYILTCGALMRLKCQICLMCFLIQSNVTRNFVYWFYILTCGALMQLKCQIIILVHARNIFVFQICFHREHNLTYIWSWLYFFCLIHVRHIPIFENEL